MKHGAQICFKIMFLNLSFDLQLWPFAVFITHKQTWHFGFIPRYVCPHLHIFSLCLCSLLSRRTKFHMEDLKTYFHVRMDLIRRLTTICMYRKLKDWGKILLSMEHACSVTEWVALRTCTSSALTLMLFMSGRDAHIFTQVWIQAQKPVLQSFSFSIKGILLKVDLFHLSEDFRSKDFLKGDILWQASFNHHHWSHSVLLLELFKVEKNL